MKFLHNTCCGMDVRRVAVIVVLGVISVMALIGYKILSLPRAAPEAIQICGYKIIRSELAVHSINSGFHGNSIEEECDAFMAGAMAEAVSRGETPPAILTMDGIPIGEFVKQSYKKIRRNPDYKPIGITLQSLKEHTGLD